MAYSTPRAWGKARRTLTDLKRVMGQQPFFAVLDELRDWQEDLFARSLHDTFTWNLETAPATPAEEKELRRLATLHGLMLRKEEARKRWVLYRRRENGKWRRIGHGGFHHGIQAWIDMFVAKADRL